MIQLDTSLSPSQKTLDALARNQNDINRTTTFTVKEVVKTGFDAKVAKAKSYWKSRTKNRAFTEIKEILDAMCSGARRCCYCEDSAADEIEHIRPKVLFPEQTFVWSNYLYACGVCNAPKNNQFAIFREDNSEFYILPKDTIPPTGTDAIINPRIENAMDVWELDLNDFVFRITTPPNTPAHRKAEYTLNELLRLNNREYLVEARRLAFENYKSHLHRYLDGRNVYVRTVIRKSPHPTVWAEMKRQYQNGKLQRIDVELCEWFAAAPEALTF